MKTNTQNSKPDTVIVNGINLQTLGAKLAADGAALGKQHEAAHLDAAKGLTSSVLDHLRELYALRADINLEISLRVYWDAYITAAPTAYAENKRGKQTKSDSLTICRAWDKGAKFPFSSNGKMVIAARAFLNPGSKKPDSKKPDSKKPGDGAPVTPAANNAQAADKFLRQQCAMLLAYCEKNKALVPDAMRFAVAELSEAFNVVPSNT